MGFELRSCGPECGQRCDGDDLAGPRVECRALVDFSIDRLEHESGELRSDVAERPFDLFRRLPEDLTDLLCTASAALRV
jgi:hypothetical protein